MYACPAQFRNFILLWRRRQKSARRADSGARVREQRVAGRSMTAGGENASGAVPSGRRARRPLKHDFEAIRNLYSSPGAFPGEADSCEPSRDKSNNNIPGFARRAMRCCSSGLRERVVRVCIHGPSPCQITTQLTCRRRQTGCVETMCTCRRPRSGAVTRHASIGSARSQTPFTKYNSKDSSASKTSRPGSSNVTSASILSCSM